MQRVDFWFGGVLLIALVGMALAYGDLLWFYAGAAAGLLSVTLLIGWARSL